MVNQVEITVSSDISEEEEEKLKLGVMNLLNALGNHLVSETSVDREERLIAIDLAEQALARLSLHRIQKVILENLNTNIQKVTWK